MEPKTNVKLASGPWKTGLSLHFPNESLATTCLSFLATLQRGLNVGGGCGQVGDIIRVVGRWQEGDKWSERGDGAFFLTCKGYHAKYDFKLGS